MANMLDLALGDIQNLITLEVQGRKVTGTKPPKNIVSMFLAAPFDDFRAYMSNYYLYLPFAAFVNLDAEKYLNKQFDIDLLYDPRTSNLKYFLKSDGVIVEMKEGCVRVNMPVTAASPYQTAMQKIGGLESIAGGAVGTISGASVGSVDTVLKSVKGAATGIFDLMKPPKKFTQGGFTPSTAIYDPLEVFLLIETPEIYYGDGIRDRYGLPDNRFVRVADVSGYCEIASVELHADATEAELNEIKTLLSSGVFIN